MAENAVQKIAVRDRKKRKANPMEQGKLWFVIPMLAVPVLNFLIFWQPDSPSKPAFDTIISHPLKMSNRIFVNLKFF